MDPQRAELRVMPGGAHLDPAPEPASPGRRSVGWEDVYRDTVVPLYRFIYARVGNRADAEDLTTKVYMRAFPRLRAGAEAADVRGYLFTTARTVMADFWRDAYDIQLTELDETLASPGTRPRRPQDEEEGMRRASRVLELLPENYRHVLELRFLKGYSLRETAEALGITVANAKVIQFRALKRAAVLGAEVLER